MRPTAEWLASTRHVRVRAALTEKDIDRDVEDEALQIMETSPMAAGCPTFATRRYPHRLAPLARALRNPTNAQARCCLRPPGFSHVTA
jgi:hypothetical protein